MTSKKRVVVIGGGMAGARLALRLGDAGRTGAGRTGAPVDLTVIGEEPRPAYNRVLLAEVLAGRYAPEVAALPHPADARVLTGVRAAAVDRAAREVRCDDGTRVPYDALVLATGSNPVLPPLRGLAAGSRELPGGVHAFRTLDDCLALRDACASRENARTVVVGGGLLGVSAARALAECGAQVVLAHQGEHLMERQLDAEAAVLLRAHLEALGVEVHTTCRARGIRTTGSGPGGRKVEAVELADGYRLDCELVVLACGVAPRTGLARAAGLEVALGIVVDDHLRTSDPRIHAVGDCAEHAGRVYGLAGAAQDQADVLARVLTGERAPDGAPPRYTGTRALTRLTLPARRSAAPAAGEEPAPSPLDLAAFGEAVARDDDDVVRLADATRSVYRKVVVRGDRLVGGILLGDLSTVGSLARTWEGDGALPAAPLLQLLT